MSESENNDSKLDETAIETQEWIQLYPFLCLLTYNRHNCIHYWF